MYMYVLLGRVPMHHVCACVPEEEVGSCGTEVTEGPQPPCGSWESNWTLWPSLWLNGLVLAASTFGCRATELDLSMVPNAF